MFESVSGALVVHDFDAAHELGIDDPATLLEAALDAERADRLVRIIDERLRIAIDTRPVTLRWGAVQVLAERAESATRFRPRKRHARAA